MRRLLIVGASNLQLPAILKAKEMGLYVGVVDYNPKAIGVEHADIFYNVSTIDKDGILSAAIDMKADGITTAATDMPMQAIAYVCEKLGMKGISYDTAVKATNKSEMSKTLRANGIPHPWYYVLNKPIEVSNVANKLTYPCISKPTDQSGSRGVILVNSPDELESAIDYSSSKGRSGSVIIEEFMSGPEVSVEVVVVDSTPYILSITDKLTSGCPHYVELGHNEYSLLSEEYQSQIVDLTIRAVKAINITNGTAHVEIIVTQKGAMIVELGARLGGEFITSHLVPLSTGIDMVKASIQIALGEIPDLTPRWSRGSAIRYFDTRKGIVKSISGAEEASAIEGVEKIEVYVKPGDQTNDLHSSLDRLGYVIAQAETPEKAIELCENAVSTIQIQIEDIDK